MKPHEIKQVLLEMGGKANKALGQHFLIDTHALEAIVEAADIQEQDWVLEIGPGLGVLTMQLLDAGANVVAIEQDRRFLDLLQGRAEKLLASPSTAIRQVGELRLVHGDAAALDWDPFIGQVPWKFVSNLPYSITSLAIRKALYRPNPPERMVVLIQREVAERAIARDGKYSLLSLMVAFACREMRIIRRVLPGAFFPPPRVQSAVLELIPYDAREREQKWGMDPERIMEIAKVGFAHPRKKVRSNLAGFVFSPENFSFAGIGEDMRAEDVLPEQWAKLAECRKKSS